MKLNLYQQIGSKSYHLPLTIMLFYNILLGPH